MIDAFIWLYSCTCWPVLFIYLFHVRLSMCQTLVNVWAMPAWFLLCASVSKFE